MNNRSTVWTALLFAAALAGGLLLTMATVLFLTGADAFATLLSGSGGIALMAAAVFATDRLNRRCVDTSIPC